MFSDLLFRLRALFRRDAMEAEMDEELRSHFENQVEKLCRFRIVARRSRPASAHRIRRLRTAEGRMPRRARREPRSKRCFRTCATRCGCCAAVPGSLLSPFLRLLLASERTPPFFRSLIPFFCGRCLTAIRRAW